MYVCVRVCVCIRTRSGFFWFCVCVCSNNHLHRQTVSHYHITLTLSRTHTHTHTHTQNKVLWACLAAMSMHGRDLDTCEMALAAIDEVINSVSHPKLMHFTNRTHTHTHTHTHARARTHILHTCIQVDKLQYIQYIKTIPSLEGRTAELTLMCGRVNEAEEILLQANLVFRAINMNITLFRWARYVMRCDVRHSL